MNADRELLQALFQFMVGRNYIQGDRDSILDMVARYKQPPLTRHFTCIMQMTRSDYDRLYALLTKIDQHLNPKENADAVLGDRADRPAGNLPLDADAQQ